MSARSALTSQELAVLGHSPRLIEQANDLVRLAEEAQRKVDQKKPQKLLPAGRAASFVLAAVLTCTLIHARDPETEKQGWLTRCQPVEGTPRYISPTFIKSKRIAIRKAKAWLNNHRPTPSLTISVQALRAGE
jgi:hypothetical protein